MNTSWYVKKYKLDTEKSDKFNREEFVNDLGKEFTEQLENTILARKKYDLSMDFKIFQQIVKNMQAKFNAISNKKLGKPLTEGLFSAFYATVVIPARAKYFPKEHEEISTKRDMYLIDKLPTEDEYWDY